MNALADRIDHLACRALAHELALEGKPGLVTPSARGSHADMDHGTFTASIGALGGYFGDCARLAASGCNFAALQARGRLAERAMFAATAGVNTHKGAIFTLGLLAAAAGRQFADTGTLSPKSLGTEVAQHWGAAILIAGAAPGAEFDATHGARLRGGLGLPGAREQAAAGFPVLFATTVPQLEHALARGATPETAAIHALLATIAVLPDTNLAHRGGLAGLHWAQHAASGFIADGGVFAPGWTRALDTLGTAFVARWLSPGGSADLLAAACFVRELPSCVAPAERAAPPVCVLA
ncbi:MAG: triphosphoribosyl-dephospho-CoA synthase [Azoarcus sp.]|nr:triphosphoribosyl-dephospho-CoA synthase [Azoarcus sp.]